MKEKYSYTERDKKYKDRFPVKANKEYGLISTIEEGAAKLGMSKNEFAVIAIQEFARQNGIDVPMPYKPKKEKQEEPDSET